MKINRMLIIAISCIILFMLSFSSDTDAIPLKNNLRENEFLKNLEFLKGHQHDTHDSGVDTFPITRKKRYTDEHSMSDSDSETDESNSSDD